MSIPTKYFDNVKQSTFEIANAINRANEHIDYIVAIAKGGIVPARYLAKWLDVKRIYSLGIEFYKDVGVTMKVPFIYQGLNTTFKFNDHILIVDDIADSGSTFKVAMQEVLQSGTHIISTCSIHYKPKSFYKPDFYYEEVPNEDWILYSWEK